MNTLTNRDISMQYQSTKFYFMRSDFLGAFAYWVVAQSPYDNPTITKALNAFCVYVSDKIEHGGVKDFTQKELNDFINSDTFENIPEIEILNHRKNGRDGMGFASRHDRPTADDDFIDLSALARNITYMMMRNQITQP
jgi:hypothetical protein